LDIPELEEDNKLEEVTEEEFGDQCTVVNNGNVAEEWRTTSAGEELDRNLMLVQVLSSRRSANHHWIAFWVMRLW
jgi:hypothetical protein